MNLGLATAKRRAQDRSAWRKLVATAASSQTRSWRRRRQRAFASRNVDTNVLQMLKTNGMHSMQHLALWTSKYSLICPWLSVLCVMVGVGLIVFSANSLRSRMCRIRFKMSACTSVVECKCHSLGETVYASAWMAKGLGLPPVFECYFRPRL